MKQDRVYLKHILDAISKAVWEITQKNLPALKTEIENILSENPKK